MLTRQELIIKWSTYAVVSQLLVLAYALVLRDFTVFGVHLFLPPLIVGVVASTEQTQAGTIFALALGVLCDLTLPGLFPCIYTLSFTLAALCCSFLAQNVLQPGLPCSIVVSALTFLFVDAFNMLALFLRGTTAFGAMVSVTLRETAFSCLLLVIFHPVLTFLHRKFMV